MPRALLAKEGTVPLTSSMASGQSFLQPGPQNSPICTIRLLDYDESVVGLAGLARNLCSKPRKWIFSCPDSPHKLTESTTEKLSYISPPLYPTTHIIKIKFTKLPISQGNPLQYSCLENPMNRGVCGLPFLGVTQSRTRLSS